VKKICFMFAVICIFLLNIIGYASDFDSELYGKANQKEFKFAVMEDGDYLVSVTTENTVISVTVDGETVEFKFIPSGYEFKITVTEGIHELVFDTEDEDFLIDKINIKLSEEKTISRIYAEDYVFHDFASVVASSLEINGESVQGLKFVDTSKDSNGRYVSYEFTVPEDGIYSVVSYVTRDTNAWASANNTYIDGTKLNLKSCDDSDENGITGDKTYVTKKVFSEIELASGIHTMRIEASQRVALAYRDYWLLYFMTDVIFVKSNSEEIVSDSLCEITIQAENYDEVSQEIKNANGGVINPVASIETAENGLAVRVNTTVAPDNGGYAFKYIFSVPKSGIYNFHIHGGSKISRYISPFEYSINGSDFVSASDTFVIYADSEITGYETLAGHHLHTEGIYLEKGEQELVIRCSTVRTSDSETYYIFLDSIMFSETGIYVPDIENSEIGEIIEIEAEVSIPGKVKGDTDGTVIEFINTGSDAVVVNDNIITVNGGGNAEIKAVLGEEFETVFRINKTIDGIGVCKYKTFSDGSFGAVIKNYSQQTKEFACVTIQRDLNGIAQSVSMKEYKLSPEKTVVVADESAENCKAETFLITSLVNYSPITDYLN